eukprot:3673359-Alexandrium_andersonii.AAC.1
MPQSGWDNIDSTPPRGIESTPLKAPIKLRISPGPRRAQGGNAAQFLARQSGLRYRRFDAPQGR